MSEDIYSIIGFRRDLPKDVALLGGINDQTLRSTFDKNIRRLNNIADANLGGIPHKTDPIVLKELVLKINNDAKGRPTEWSSSELRTLAYNLSEFHDNEKLYYYALSLLEKNWDDRLFRGINNYLMSHWNTIPKKMLHDSTEFLQHHLEKYSGDSKRLLEQKKNIDFFLEGGPTRLGQLAKARNVELQEAPRLIGYSPTSLTLDYFSDTILSFYQSRDILEKIEEIKSLLINPSHKRRTRMLISVRLVKMTDNADESKQSIVSNVASSLLGGDVTKPYTWNPYPGATEEEINRIEYAQYRVNQWLVKRIINVFFEKCVQDPDRKYFWLRYVPNISRFKIVGSELVRANLTMDNRVRNHLNDVFRLTNQSSKETSALVLWIKDKIFVEFSDVGALYVYNSENPYIRRCLDRRQIERVEDLKIPTRSVGNDKLLPYGQLIEILDSYYGSYYFNDEGKLDHRGEWSYRLSQYMEKKMDIYVSSLRRS